MEVNTCVCLGVRVCMSVRKLVAWFGSLSSFFCFVCFVGFHLSLTGRVGSMTLELKAFCDTNILRSSRLLAC